MLICSIIGTRPQFIKAVLVSKKLEEKNGVEEFIINTNQHYDKNMSDVFFSELKIPKAKYNLKINGMNHGEMTGKMMIEIEKILLNEKPDAVLVYGDCNTTLAGGLVATKMGIKLIHVESGLRSFDRFMPEELNRILVDSVSDILLCPTTSAINNLRNEGIIDQKNNRIVKLTGDLMVELLENNKNYILESREKILKPILGDVDHYILMTIHRASNTTKNNLSKIMSAVGNIKIPIIFALHPRTKKVIKDNLIDLPENIKIIEPQPYLPMMALISASSGVITDSGGLQKEAYAWEKKCATMRETTEWIETLEGGQNILINPNTRSEDEICQSLNKLFIKDNIPNFPPLYGENVAQIIIDTI